MSDNKLLQTILNGQGALHQEINRVEKNLIGLISKLDDKVDNNTARLNKIGRQLAYLEDDTPTREEHDNLEKRVTIIEKTISS